MKKSQSRRAQPQAGSGSILKQYKVVGISCVVGIVVIFCVLLLCAAVMSAVDVPHSAVVPMSVLAVVTGCLVSGFLCAQIHKSTGLVFGLLCGTVIFLLAFAAELLVVGNEVGVLALYKYVIYAASGMIGGVLGVNKRRKVR